MRTLCQVPTELLQIVQQGPLEISFEQFAGSRETQEFEHHGITNEIARRLQGLDTVAGLLLDSRAIRSCLEAVHSKEC
jgi:hypothetical protein